MTQLVFPLDPIKHVNQAAEPVFNRLADALEQAAAGLAAGDRYRTRQALEQARAIDPLVRSFQQTLTVGYQVARLAPFRRRALGELDPYASAARQVDYAVRNTRVLARSAMVLLAAERPAPSGLVAGSGLSPRRCGPWAVRSWPASRAGRRSGRPCRPRCTP